MKKVFYLFVAIVALAALPAQAQYYMNECEPEFFTTTGQHQTATSAVDPFSSQIGDANADGHPDDRHPARQVCHLRH